MASVLTAQSVRIAKPDAAKRREIPDAVLPGLYLLVQPSGHKSWALRYRFAGKPKKLTLGRVLIDRATDIDDDPVLGQSMTLAEARRAAKSALQTLGEGQDPARKKKAAKALQAIADNRGGDIVRELAKAFVERYSKPRNRSWREIERQFKSEINPLWGDRQVVEVRKRDVIELLDGIVDRGSPVTANRVFATVRKFFSWLVERDVLETSPCAGVKRPTAEKPRSRVLNDDEIVRFWKIAGGMEYPFGPMFQLLLLTGQRRQEVGGMVWRELDLASEPTWSLPQERTKNGKAHHVPLAPLAVEIIEDLPRIKGSPFLFSTTGTTPASGYSRAKARLDKLMAEEEGIEPWTLHDLRRTMASKMAGLNINLPVIEKCLNHVSGSFRGIVGVYQHHEFREEKRRAFNAWADYVLALMRDTEPNVVRLTGGIRDG